MSDIVTKVSHVFESLTQSQRVVANYVTENADTIAFYTLDDLAMRIGVSTTTVIRFARSLGFSGYSDMQRDIQSSIKGKVSLPERLSETAGNLKRDKLLVDTYQNDIENISLTMSELPESDLKAAVSAIISGKNVYVLGLRGSFALAYYMATRLGQIRKQVHLFQAIGLTYPEEIVSTGSGDVCIVYMFPRYSKMTANVVLCLKKRGVKIILFTSKNYSAIQSYGDIILPCSIKGVSFKDSFVAPMCLSNYIVSAVAIENYAGAMEILAQTEEMLDQGYYLGL